MDAIAELFLSYQSILFALGIFVITYVIRLSVQTFWKSWRASLIYNELVLHLLPLLLGGGIAALAKKFPWPSIIAESLSGRIFYGLVMGLFCGFLYGRVRKFLGDNTQDAPSPAAVVAEPPKPEETVKEPDTSK